MDMLEVVGEGLDVLGYVVGGDFGVNLGGVYVGVWEKGGEGLDG